MRLTIRHTIRVSLATPPRAALQLLLTPLSTPQQRVERWSIAVSGGAEPAAFRDGFGNRAHLVTLVKPEDPIEIVVTGTVETSDRAGVLGRLDHDPVPAVFKRRSDQAPADAALVEGLSADKGRIALLHALMDRVHAPAEAGQSQSQSAGKQSHSQMASPSARDAAHAFIGAARELDIPARYVTGYLFEADKVGIHAWAEVWDEGLGWIGFDPVLNVCPTTEHVRVATGLDAANALAVRCVPALAGAPDEAIELVDDDAQPST